jgi:thymidylate synthase (FAD)
MLMNRIVTKPTVYLIGKQDLSRDAMQKFLSDEGLVFETDTDRPPEILAEAAGRVCYMSYGKGRKTNAEYIENIIASHHGSVLEHVVWNFIVTGISRSLTHELIRHRAGWAYSQLSQRYVDESEARYVLPPLYREDENLKKKWEEAVGSAHEAYVALVEATDAHVRETNPELKGTDRRKLVRQSARSVLPNACETKVFISANARALRHFVEMRGSAHADTEIRELAVEIAKTVKAESPNIFADVEIVQEDNIETVRVTHSKV